MPPRASWVQKRCPMHNEACATRVAEHLTRFMGQPFTVADAMALIEKQCGRLTRGAHKGALRGWATIAVCTRGGWKRGGYGEGNGHVVLPGTIMGVRISDFNGKVFLSEGEGCD